MTLTAANRAALEHVRAATRRERARLRARLARTDLDELAAALRRAPLTINFHPDRVLAERVTGGAPLDAANIGAAAVAAARDPETLQHLKYLWRMVVAWGEP